MAREGAAVSPVTVASAMITTTTAIMTTTMIMNTTAIMTTIMITITTRGSANCSAWHQAGIKTPPRHGYSAILCALRSGHCS
jgi:hypothetical protein